MTIATEDVLRHELALIGMSLAATGQERPAASITKALDLIQSLSERIAVLEGALERLVEDVENAWGDPHTLAEARKSLTKAD